MAEQKLSFPDFKDRTSEETNKAKTKIGEYAGEKKYYNTVLDPSTSREAKLEMIKAARDEGDNEVKRETRGKAAPEPTPATDAAKKQANEDKDFEKYSKERPDQKYAKGGKVSSASSRADGIAQRGKTKGTMVMCGGGKA